MVKLTSCANEKEVRELITRGCWPAACTPELRAHVSACRACGDLVLVAQAFRQARAESTAAARPVSPALLLWRAELRRHDAAMERIGRPIFGAQIFAFAVMLVAALGFAGLEARDGAAWATWAFWRDWLAQLPQAAAAHWRGWSSGAADTSGWSWMVLAAAAASLLLLSGAAIFLANDQ